jgi:hypothetical protein
MVFWTKCGVQPKILLIMCFCVDLFWNKEERKERKKERKHPNFPDEWAFCIFIYPFFILWWNICSSCPLCVCLTQNAREEFTGFLKTWHKHDTVCQPMARVQFPIRFVPFPSCSDIQVAGGFAAFPRFLNKGTRHRTCFGSCIWQICCQRHVDARSGFVNCEVLISHLTIFVDMNLTEEVRVCAMGASSPFLLEFMFHQNMFGGWKV